MPTDRQLAWRRGLWFVGLWAAGVVVVIAATGILRFLLGVAT